MQIKIFIRSDKRHPAKATMRADYNCESGDSPRVHNLGLDIYNQLQEIIESCEKRGYITTEGFNVKTKGR